MEVVAEFDDLQTNEEHSSARKSFSLRAFSEMQDPSNSAIIPQDLYKNPRSVVEMDKGIQQTSDDSVITRLTMGKMAAFEASQKATTTTARRFHETLELLCISLNLTLCLMRVRYFLTHLSTIILLYSVSDRMINYTCVHRTLSSRAMETFTKLSPSCFLLLLR